MARTTTERRSAGNLPAGTTSFVGRRHELTEVKRLLSVYRLVTLTGPGGVGKTRLSMRVAADVRRAFHDQAWFVDLGELREPNLVPQTVAEQLEIHEQSSRPVQDAVVERLGAGPTLLVLDSCEHLVDACAALVNTLIQVCPELRVVATSRQSLGLVGECTYTVPPFEVPDPEHAGSPNAVAHFDSVRLFVARAAAVLPSFEVDQSNYQALARICHDLDGIPLAIELTAVRLRSLSLEQIADRLTEQHRLLGEATRGLPPRQRTLRALIDWSYELCSAPERLVWARASVFSGSFDLDAVEHVASGDGVAEADVLGLVDALVDKSIFLRDSGQAVARYRMLDTTRAYGVEKLAAGGGHEAARRRHRDYFAGLTRRFAAEWLGPDEPAWINRLWLEHPNLRVAFDYCARQEGEAEAGLRMVVQLADFLSLRGYHTETRMWLDRLLASATEPSHERLSSLMLDAWFALQQGDAGTARSSLGESEDLAARIGSSEELAYLAHLRGMEALVEADVDRADPLFGEAYERFRTAGSLRGEMLTLFLYGLTVGHRGQAEKGRMLLDACIDKSVRLGDTFWRSHALWAHAYVDVAAGEPERAERSCKESLRLGRLLADRTAMAFSLETLAWVEATLGRHGRAATLFGLAASVWESLGGSPEFYSSFAHAHHAHVAGVREALGDSAYEQAFEQGHRLSAAQAVDFALETERPRDARQPTGEQPLLTRREFQIAELVAEGLTNRDIAARLVISTRTAEGHVENILTKLGFSSRTQIAAWVTARQESAQR
ncbi:non-specific serine/threonine protein kinase [Saccharopolyspora erythraea NRRL 2338]|uniref:Protein kinase/transcriptional regulator, LuxR family n=2 Tax=Saccharopolyspora erythraea TaxID=1836 RepID=A4FB66_SACEN|nr:LuxR C-terminal-related transcriptional regulator [Saccharopolyspora erythraea]EQD83969.1 LuxR family transcriptional regulator [Saccharopolyspora erythraea D]PFG95073.1 non-specific serine/threonine protein kinase [Saccharopolyspora erythraea NRRL 2338]QRK91752.1 LuxR family transcriptional regulator [Saccharopolyspora erythraea]CAM01291.1 protein kinase/transcriptional regulator, LuxR family [Saccharopolyspora erythraea NRRL 2338]